jgi:predicted nucleotidyltransferase
MGEVPRPALYATAALDLVGGLGVVLPSPTRVRPGLTVLAAAGCAALQASAVAFHLARGEASEVGFNVFLVALSLLVAWARRVRAPILPR